MGGGSGGPFVSKWVKLLAWVGRNTDRTSQSISNGMIPTTLLNNNPRGVGVGGCQTQKCLGRAPLTPGWVKRSLVGIMPLLIDCVVFQSHQTSVSLSKKKKKTALLNFGLKCSHVFSKHREEALSSNRFTNVYIQWQINHNFL